MPDAIRFSRDRNEIRRNHFLFGTALCRAFRCSAVKIWSHGVVFRIRHTVPQTCSAGTPHPVVACKNSSNNPALQLSAWFIPEVSVKQAVLSSCRTNVLSSCRTHCSVRPAADIHRGAGRPAACRVRERNCGVGPLPEIFREIFRPKILHVTNFLLPLHSL